MAKDSNKGVWGMYRRGRPAKSPQERAEYEAYHARLKQARKLAAQRKQRSTAEKGKAARAKYFKTEKGIAARNRVQAKKRRLIINAKAVPCADCGRTYPSYVMDFDHRDPSCKAFNMGRAHQTQSLARIEEEIAKCDVVCANCHRIRTWGSKTAASS